MAKLGKTELARHEGAKWALEMIEKKGLEEAKQELEWRGVMKAPLSMLDRAELDRFQHDVKENCIRTISCMSLLTLRDEFSFGEKRLRQFMKRFNLKTDVLEDNYATWDDYKQILLEEVGIDVDVEEMYD